MHDEQLKFVDYSREFLDLSWGWLNDPEIKKLTGTPSFTKQQQEVFFSSLPRDNYLVWGLKYGDVAIGVVGLKAIKDGCAEYFGYIGEKEYWGRNLFSKIISIIKDECNKIEVKYIYLHVSVDNVRAIKSYEKNGFKIEPALCTKQQKYMSTEVS